MTKLRQLAFGATGLLMAFAVPWNASAAVISDCLALANVGDSCLPPPVAFTVTSAGSGGTPAVGTEVAKVAVRVDVLGPTLYRYLYQIGEVDYTITEFSINFPTLLAPVSNPGSDSGILNPALALGAGGTMVAPDPIGFAFLDSEFDARFWPVAAGGSGEINPGDLSEILRYDSELSPADLEATLVGPDATTPTDFFAGVPLGSIFIGQGNNVVANASTLEEHPVPEPATMFLLGACLVGLAAFRRRATARAWA